MSIRRMRWSDLKAVYQAESECFTFDAWPISIFSEALYQSSYHYVAETQSGDLIGYMITDHNDPDRIGDLIAPDDKPLVTINSIGIRTKYQRQGWAQALIKQLITDLEPIPSHLSLMTRVSNHRAMALYKKLGFTKYPKVIEKYYHRPAEDSYLMYRLYTPLSEASRSSPDQSGWVRLNPSLILRPMIESDLTKVLDLFYHCHGRESGHTIRDIEHYYYNSAYQYVVEDQGIIVGFLMSAYLHHKEEDYKILPDFMKIQPKSALSDDDWSDDEEDHQWLITEEEGYSTILCLTQLGIHESYRRQGLAQRLIKTLLEATKINPKGEYICLQADVTKQEALNLYEKMGFVKHTEPLKGYYWSSHDAHLFYVSIA